MSRWRFASWWRAQSWTRRRCFGQLRVWLRVGCWSAPEGIITAALLRPCQTREFRIGYAAMAGNSLFSQEMSNSLRLAAAANNIELIEVDNRMSARVAIRNSERLVRDRVDLAIEFQVHQRAAAQIAVEFLAGQVFR